MASNNPGSSNAIAGAITYPSGNAVQQYEPVPVQPRQPRTLQGLLKFAMEATKAEDAPGNSQLGPMDEERRKFLEEALKGMQVDLVEIIHNALKVLTDKERIDRIRAEDDMPEDVQTAFQNLLDYVDDLDVARDFYKMGGYAMFPICYGCANSDVRRLAYAVLGEVCQNNPFCQTRALETGLLEVLLNLVQTEQGRALTKCVYAISCITRECVEAGQRLIAQGGCEALAVTLQAPDTATRTKVAFLIRYLCKFHQDAKDIFILQNLVEIITEQIKAGRDESSEHLLCALEALVEDLSPAVVRQCKDPKLGLKQILEDHLKHPELEGNSFSEEKKYCQSILQKVFVDAPNIVEDCEAADR